MIDIHIYELLAAAAIFLVTLIGLNRILFGPFARIMQEREKLTIGRIEEADRLAARAEQLSRDYETRIRNEKFENYRRQEERRNEALTRRAAAIAETRKRAEQMIVQGRSEISRQVETAKASLGVEAQDIAALISRQILGRDAQ